MRNLLRTLMLLSAAASSYSVQIDAVELRPRWMRNRIEPPSRIIGTQIIKPANEHNKLKGGSKEKMEYHRQSTTAVRINGTSNGEGKQVTQSSYMITSTRSLVAIRTTNASSEYIGLDTSLISIHRGGPIATGTPSLVTPMVVSPPPVELNTASADVPAAIINGTNQTSAAGFTGNTSATSTSSGIPAAITKGTKRSRVADFTGLAPAKSNLTPARSTSPCIPAAMPSGTNQSVVASFTGLTPAKSSLSGIPAEITSGTNQSGSAEFTGLTPTKSTPLTTIGIGSPGQVKGTGANSTYGDCRCTCLCDAGTFKPADDSGLPLIVGLSTSTMETVSTSTSTSQDFSTSTSASQAFSTSTSTSQAFSTSTSTSQAPSIQDLEPTAALPLFPLTTITYAISSTTTPQTTTSAANVPKVRIETGSLQSKLILGNIETSLLNSKLSLGGLKAEPSTSA